jgi:hypothetical protein
VSVCLSLSLSQGPFFYRNRAGLPYVLAPDPYKIAFLARKRRVRQCWKLVLFTLFLVYPYVSSNVLRTFSCREVEGVHYLIADFSVRCFDSRWDRFLPYSIIMILVYPVGIPLLFFSLLWFVSIVAVVFCARENSLTPAQHRYDFNRVEIRLQLGFLYDGYASDTWWFEMVDMLHKLVLTSLLVLFPPDAQLPVAMVASTIYTMVILVKKPYYRKGDDRLHLYAQVEIFLLLLAGYAFFRGSIDSLDDSMDALMSAFLIIVVLGFIGVFVAQSFKILKKMWRDYRRGQDDSEPAAPVAACVGRANPSSSLSLCRRPLLSKPLAQPALRARLSASRKPEPLCHLDDAHFQGPRPRRAEPGQGRELFRGCGAPATARSRRQRRRRFHDAQPHARRG